MSVGGGGGELLWTTTGGTPTALPFYATSLVLYGGFCVFVIVRLLMHLQCKPRRPGGGGGADKHSGRKGECCCKCTTNYKSHTHLFIALFLLFRTCDFITCTLRCSKSATLCQDFSANNIHVRLPTKGVVEACRAAYSNDSSLMSARSRLLDCTSSSVAGCP